MKPEVHRLIPVTKAQENKSINGDVFEESVEDKKSRWRSIHLACLIMFIGSLDYSIVITSIWPYLQSITYTKDTTFLGWLLCAFGLGQFVFAPILGLWSNYVDVKWPILTTLTLAVFANTLYGYAGAFPSHNGIVMLVARFCLGIRAGNVAVIKSYVSGATTVKERTSAVANFSTAQTIGLMIGPVIQTALTPLGETGLRWDLIKLTLNMYTTAAFLVTLLGIVTLVLFLLIFKSYRIPDTMDEDTEDYQSIDDGKVDKVAAFVAALAFSLAVFSMTYNETILVPLTMAMYAWSRNEAVLYNGILLTGGACVAVLSFLAVKYLSKRCDERKILLGSLAILITGYTLQIPMPFTFSHPPAPQVAVNSTDIDFNTLDCEGARCGCYFDWCTYTPQLFLSKYIVAVTCVSFGFAATILTVTTIYSKILGPKPQGLFMGLLTAGGSFSRMVGPVIVGFMFAEYGPVWSFLSISIVLLLNLVMIIVMYRRLVPMCQR